MPTKNARIRQVTAQQVIAFDGLGEGVLVLDGAGRVVAVNGALESICNYSPAEVVGQTLDFLNSPLHVFGDSHRGRRRN